MNFRRFIKSSVVIAVLSVALAVAMSVLLPLFVVAILADLAGSLCEKIAAASVGWFDRLAEWAKR